MSRFFTEDKESMLVSTVHCLSTCSCIIFVNASGPLSILTLPCSRYLLVHLWHLPVSIKITHQVQYYMWLFWMPNCMFDVEVYSLPQSGLAIKSLKSLLLKGSLLSAEVLLVAKWVHCHDTLLKSKNHAHKSKQKTPKNKKTNNNNKINRQSKNSSVKSFLSQGNAVGLISSIWNDAHTYGSVFHCACVCVFTCLICHWNVPTLQYQHFRM